MANNRICLVCGKAYEYCNSCNRKRLPVWMNLFHEENCKKIFDTANDYTHKIINASDAKKILSTCNLERSAFFKGGVKKVVDELMTAPQVVLETSKTILNEDTIKEKEDLQQINESKVVNKPSKKKTYVQKEKISD